MHIIVDSDQADTIKYKLMMNSKYRPANYASSKPELARKWATAESRRVVIDRMLVRRDNYLGRMEQAMEWDERGAQWNQVPTLWSMIEDSRCIPDRLPHGRFRNRLMVEAYAKVTISYNSVCSLISL